MTVGRGSGSATALHRDAISGAAERQDRAALADAVAAVPDAPGPHDAAPVARHAHAVAARLEPRLGPRVITRS